MAKIKGIEGLTTEEMNQYLAEGAKFIVFKYTISIIVMTFNRSSDIYFVKKGEPTFNKGIGFTLITLVFGWWGIPWGPIYTIGSLYRNFTGGKDVTAEIINAMNATPVNNKGTKEPSEDILDDILMDEK